MDEQKRKDLGIMDVLQAFIKNRGVKTKVGRQGRGKSALYYARIGWNTKEEIMGQQFVWFFYSQSKKKIDGQYETIKSLFTRAENAGMMVFDDVDRNDINLDMLLCSDNGASIGREDLVMNTNKDEQNHFLYVTGQGNKLKEEEVIPILRLISGNVFAHGIKAQFTTNLIKNSEEDVGKILRQLGAKTSKIV